MIVPLAYLIICVVYEFFQDVLLYVLQDGGRVMQAGLDFGSVIYALVILTHLTLKAVVPT